MFHIKKGFFWYGGERNLEFDLTKAAIGDYENLKKVFPKKQGFIITTQYGTIKKEAGAFNYFIKKNNKWNRLKIEIFKKMFFKD